MISRVIPIVDDSCSDKEDCFGKKWGPKMFSALSAINKGYRAANGDIFDERIWLSADDAMALVVDHHQGDVKLLTGNHKYTVLHGLEKLGLLDRVTEPKLRFSLNKKGFVCGPCIVKNGWV